MDASHHVFDDGQEQLAQGDGKALQGRLQNGELALEVVQLCVRHLLGRAAAGDDGLLQIIPGVAGVGEEGVDGGEVGLVEDGGDNVGLLGGGHAVHAGVQIPQHIVEGAHIPLGVVHIHAKLLHAGRSFVCGVLQGEDDVAQMRTALGSLDAIVGEDAEGGVQFGGAAFDALGSGTDSEDGLAELGHRGVRGGGGLSHLVHHCGGLVRSHAQGGHGIGHHVGGGGQVDAASRRQVEDGGQRVAHLLGVVASQGEVVQSLRTFAGGEGRLAAHLLGEGGEGVHRVHALAVDR